MTAGPQAAVAGPESSQSQAAGTREVARRWLVQGRETCWCGRKKDRGIGTPCSVRLVFIRVMEGEGEEGEEQREGQGGREKGPKLPL